MMGGGMAAMGQQRHGQDGQTIFTAITGEMITVRSSAVGVATRNQDTMADRELSFTCRVTRHFEQVAGTLRRKVVELDPPLLGGITEAWLGDAPLAPADDEDRTGGVSGSGPRLGA